MVTPKNALPVAWQVAHPVAMPVWFIGVPGPKVAGVVVGHLWQVPHCGVVTVMWVAGLPTAVVPSWHPPVAQVVVDVTGGE
jgi:hypothetical protein